MSKLYFDNFKLILSIDAPVLTANNDKAKLSEEEISRRLEKVAIMTKEPFKQNVAVPIPMAWYEEMLVCVIWGCFFGYMLYVVPFLIFMCVYYRTCFYYCVAALVLISFIPFPYQHNLCRSYLTYLTPLPSSFVYKPPMM